MNPNPNRFNQIEHDTSVCDCDMCQFARNSAQRRVNPPSEAPTTGKGDAGFLVPEAENVVQGDSDAVMAISAPTFDQEWQDAPRWATRYTERQVAEWWFIRGQHAKEVELVAGTNGELKEMVRVARERIKR